MFCVFLTLMKVNLRKMNEKMSFFMFLTLIRLTIEKMSGKLVFCIVFGPGKVK